MPKLLLRLLALTSEEMTEEVPNQQKAEIHTAKLQRYQYGTRSYRLDHIAPERLEHIIHQVQAEDYHVEYLTSFAWEDSQPVEVMAAVTRWAKRSGLKVSINHERGICFFEADSR
jgi:hypothetical protein